MTLFNVAASDSESVLGMEMPILEDSGLDNYYMAHLSNDPSNATMNVFCIPLDCFNFPHPISFIKIDVEGHEFTALKGMEKLIRKDHPVIVAEGHTDEVVSFLENLGYSNRRYENSPNTLYEYSPENNS